MSGVGSGPPESSKSQSSNPRLTGKVNQRPVEQSMFEYILYAHASHVQSRAALIALLIHSEILSRGARPGNADEMSKAVIDNASLKADPIRLFYSLISRPKSGTLSTVSCRLQISVVETDSHIFVNLTDPATDKFGYLEISGVEHVRLDALANADTPQPQDIFPQLNELLDLIEERLWKPVLPSPPLDRSVETEKDKPPQCSASDNTYRPHSGPQDPYAQSGPTGKGAFPDYGRRDLDPLGVGSSHGGMLLDPRSLVRPMGNRFIGGPDVLPPGAVPPGARFDPFGPGIVPHRPNIFGNRHHHPDPDHAYPPGFDDMYM